MSKKFSPFYTNNVSKNFNRTMDRIYNIIQKRTYYKERKTFEARILTGEASNSATNGFFDIISGTLFGKEKTTAFKIRFSGKDNNYNSLPNPDDYSGEDRINIITLHPFAYLIDDKMPTPNEGSFVVVDLIDDVYVIKKVLDGTHSARTTSPSKPSSGYKIKGREDRGKRDPSRSDYEEVNTNPDGSLLVDDDYTDRSKQKHNLSYIGGDYKDGLSWEELKQLSKTAPIQKLLDECSRGEGSLDSFNVCGGLVTSVPKERMIEYYGIPVSQMTIHYIATVLQRTKSFACADGRPAKVFAVGRFQMIPQGFYGKGDE